MMIGAGKRVLVVEDDKAVRCLLIELLERHGFRAVAISNGMVAVRLLHHDHFDVVITDLNSPFMDGLDLIRYVDQRWPELPVILMSGNSGEFGRSPMAMGGAACISKPVDTEKLLHTLGQALKL
jgi:CheY-like chemotaxis protein